MNLKFEIKLDEKDHVINKQKEFIAHLMSLSHVLNGEEITNRFKFNVRNNNKFVTVVYNIDGTILFWLKTNEYALWLYHFSRIRTLDIADMHIGYVSGLSSPFMDGTVLSCHSGDYYEVHFTITYKTIA